jgi:hypothetical protein
MSTTDDIITQGYDAGGNIITQGYAAAPSLLSAVPAPTGLSASAGNEEVVLTWTNPVDADFASVNLRQDGTVVYSGAGDSFTDTGLLNGTQYSYTVASVDTLGEEGPVSAVVSASPIGGAHPDITGPTQVLLTDGRTPLNQFRLKQGDTLPPLKAILASADGTVVDLTNVRTLSFWMRKLNRTVLLKGSAVVLDPSTNGRVQYDWQAADTQTGGWYFGQFKVTFTDGGAATFPDQDYILIFIDPDPDLDALLIQ